MNDSNQTTWPGTFADIPLRVDPQREAEATGEVEAHPLATGIYVRAMRDNIPGSYDIATLDRDSLFRWLRSRGGANPWAENIVAALLGQAPPTARAFTCTP